MTRYFEYCPSASEGDNQSVGSSVKVVSMCVDLEILKVILRRRWHEGHLVDIVFLRIEGLLVVIWHCCTGLISLFFSWCGTTWHCTYHFEYNLFRGWFLRWWHARDFGSILTTNYVVRLSYHMFIDLGVFFNYSKYCIVDYLMNHFVSLWI